MPNILFMQYFCVFSVSKLLMADESFTRKYPGFALSEQYF